VEVNKAKASNVVGTLHTLAQPDAFDDHDVAVLSIQAAVAWST
jgi:hypothetical protein